MDTDIIISSKETRDKGTQARGWQQPSPSTLTNTIQGTHTAFKNM